MITPEIAKEKLRVTTVLTHPAVVTTPVLLGNRVEEHEITRVNALTGRTE